MSSGDLASGVAESPARGFGGSSRRWGGQALPFTPLDLEDRACTACRGGWPISWAELQPNYRVADRFLGLSALPFDSDLWHCRRLRSAFGEQSGLALSVSKYSPHAYLARVHQGRIGRSSQADCLLHARVAWIEAAAEPGAAHRIRIRNSSGREATLEARVVVLCAGGIENARMLLSSQRHGNLQLGDGADGVGRHYHDHLGFFAAQREPIDWPAFGHLFSSFIPGNQEYVPKLQLSQQRQRGQGLLNVTGNLDVQEADDSPRNAARRLYNSLRRRRPGTPSLRSTLHDLGRLLAAAPESAGLLRSHLLERRIGLPRRARFFLMANAESEPLADSRILLSARRDGFGLERPIVHWRVSEGSFRALQVNGQELQSTLEGSGIARVRLSPYLTDPSADWRERAYSLYHHMGATRMAHHPRDGVVDSFGRLHGVAGIYVTGTSVLPTGSASNPSYTALALALRSADQLLRDT